MAKNISEKDIFNLVDRVKHPVINRTLREFGIIKEISIKDDKVLIIMAFPFANIPIKDQLVRSVRESIERVGAEVKMRYTIMNQYELQAFFKNGRSRLDRIKRYQDVGIWVELITLIIPGYNDYIDKLEHIAEFIKNVDAGIPWHVTRFYPVYKLANIAPTSKETLKNAI